ncbi:MAG TPA: OmpA family protein [Steroidobacteraceae bacterium]
MSTAEHLPAGQQRPAGADAPPSPATTPAPVVLPEGVRPVSEIADLKPGAQCPDPGSAGSEITTRAAAARIPLKVGLTLSYTWKGHADDYEHECLTQVTQIDGRSILTENSCPSGPKHVVTRSTRRLCLSNMADSHLYLTGTWYKYPETFVGALNFNLSVASFAALKGRGEFRHSYVNLYDTGFAYSDHYIDGTLRSEGSGTFKVMINGKITEVPTIEASSWGQKNGDRIRIKVLDDAAFPLMLDYYIPSMDKFFITYSKISYPTAHDLEQELSLDKHADIYGIYFDFAQASLRSESEPVLQEIAAAMQAHPDWKLVINGHTDNVGTDPENLALSRQRSQTVRQALIDRYEVDASRLTTNGFGASQPKEKNDTDRGRALNRRVELIRQ